MSGQAGRNRLVPRSRLAATAPIAIAVAGMLAACNRPLFERPKPAVERVNPNIPGGQFHSLASIAGGDALTDFQISATVREQLQDSGFTVVRKAGRWDSQPEAVRAICTSPEPPQVDGVLFVWYNRLELIHCGTATTAYEITSRGQEGITVLTQRLLRYLRLPERKADSTSTRG